MRISPVNNRIFKQSFKANHSKENTVAVLGGTKFDEQRITDYRIASELTSCIIAYKKNILTDASTRGIIGQVFYTAADYSKKDENGIAVQNLAIMQSQDEQKCDSKECVVLDVVESSEEKIRKLLENADAFLIFPGDSDTDSEITSVIAHNFDAENKKKIILVGKDYFAGLDKNYNELYKRGLLQVNPKELYTLVDSSKEAAIILGIYPPDDVEDIEDLEE